MGKGNRHFNQQQAKGETKVSDNQDQLKDQTGQEQGSEQQPQTDGEGQATGETGGETTTPASIPGVDTTLATLEVKTSFAPQQQVQTQQPKRDVKVQPVNTQNVTRIEQQLVSYIESMQPSLALDPKVGGQWQASLFNLIRTVLNNSDQEQFRREWNTILNVANREKDGVFHENYIMRFPQNWKLSDAEAALFRRLITVINMSADPQNRFNFGSTVRLDTVVQGLNETQTNNFLNFYS